MLVLISATGWEKDMTIKSAIKSKADKIILVTSEIKKDTPVEDVDIYVQKLAKETEEELKKYFQTDIIEVDYSDYPNTFEKISLIVKKEKDAGNEVRLNITEGSKLLAAVFMTVAFTQNVGVLYFFPKKYNYELLPKEKPLREGIWKAVEIPPLPQQFKMTKKAREILKMMETKEINVKDYIQRFNLKDENRARAEFNYYIDKLENYGLIKVAVGMKKKNCTLTESGKLLMKSA